MRGKSEVMRKEERDVCLNGGNERGVRWGGGLGDVSLLVREKKSQ